MSDRGPPFKAARTPGEMPEAESCNPHVCGRRGARISACASSLVNEAARAAAFLPAQALARADAQPWIPELDRFDTLSLGIPGAFPHEADSTVPPPECSLLCARLPLSLSASAPIGFERLKLVTALQLASAPERNPLSVCAFHSSIGDQTVDILKRLQAGVRLLLF